MKKISFTIIPHLNSFGRIIPHHYELGMNGEFPKSISKQRALELSIDKWHTIVDFLSKKKVVRMYDSGISTCGLCHKYLGDYDEPNCHGCPVSEASGSILCDGTPYQKWKGKSLVAAKQELAFLKGLRTRKEEP